MILRALPHLHRSRRAGTARLAALSDSGPTTSNRDDCMPSNKKRKRSPAPPPTVPRAPRTPKRTGPSRNEAQLVAQRKAQRQQTLRRRGVTAALVLLGLGAVAAVVVLDRRGDAQLRAELTAGSCQVDTRADRTAPAGQNHVPAPSYQVDPPAGGDHLAGAARAGSYRGTSVPQDGALVHSLEHGYVIAWHRPDLPPDQLQQLTDLQTRHGEDVIVAERADLPVPVAATAWGQRLLCQQAEAGPLQRFVDEHVGNGPEDVPRG